MKSIVNSDKVARYIVSKLSLQTYAPFSSSSINSVNSHVSSKSPIPLIENYRSRWPQPSIAAEIKNIDLPKRTVPDECLEFEVKSSFEQGSAIFYPHLQFNPADFKVKLRVRNPYIILNALNSIQLLTL